MKSLSALRLLRRAGSDRPSRLRAWVMFGALTGGLGFLGGSIMMTMPAVAAPAVAILDEDETDANTEDVLVMRDGRVLHGRIVDERRDLIMFEFEAEGIKSRITVFREDIESIRRDVAVVRDDADRPAERQEDVRRGAGETGETGRPAEIRSRTRTIGLRRAGTAEEEVPRMLIIPMNGQMGTDIHPSIYEEMVEEIRSIRPDVLVLQLESAEPVDDEIIFSTIQQMIRGTESGFHGSANVEEYRELIRLFRIELRDIPQVVWIHDSVGISSIMALVWDNVYMTPTARLGGLGDAAINFMRVAADSNTLGKYREAYVSQLKGFLEHSKHDLRLVDAMIRPEFKLSATWRGRDVEWSLDDSGEYIVNNSTGSTVNFSAKHAEDFRLSSGTAETIDDLALLLGMREYRVVGSRAENMFDRYVLDWRRGFERAVQSMLDFQKNMDRVGEDPVRYLGAARTELERIVSLMRRFNAIELRLGRFGVSRFALETQIEVITEQLRTLRQRGGRGGGQGGGVGGGIGGR